MNPPIPNEAPVTTPVVASESDYSTVIRNVLATLHIQRVVYIDDCFEKGVEFIKEHILVGLRDSEHATQVRSLLEGIGIEEGEDGEWIEELRQWWQQADGIEQQRVRQEIYDLRLIPDEKDQEAAAALRELLSSSPIDYCPVSPAEWYEKKDEWIQQADKDKKLLCLFDKQFSYEAPGKDIAINGLDMLDEAIVQVRAAEDNYDGRVLFGIFSHEFSIVEERAEGAKICSDHAIPNNIFLPISKERRNDLPKLAEGIQMLILNLYAGTMKRIIKTVMDDACKEANNKLDELDIFAFDDIVLNSSIREGVWEGETLIRLFLFLQQRSAWTGLAAHKVAQKFNQQVQIARAIAGPRLTVKDTTDELHQLRRLELYHSHPILNKLHSPIRLGDIFQLKADKRYILLAPPCDLMVRSGEKDEGKRGKEKNNELQYVELFRITDITEAKRQELSISQLNVCSFLHHYKSNKIGKISFKERIVVPIRVLDLAVLNDDGKCLIDLNNLPGVPPQFHPAWRKRHQLLIESFQEMAKPMRALASMVENPEIKQEEREALQIAVDSYLNPNQALPGKPTYKSGVLDFQFARVDHYRFSSAQHLLSSYSHFLNRPAEDHDFTAVSRTSVQ